MVHMTAASLNLEAMGQRARQASYQLAALSTARKNDALHAIADALEAQQVSILAANQRDLNAAAERGTDPVWMRDRMALDKRLPGIIADVRRVVELEDPVGEVFDQRTLDNGLHISRRRVPLGVLGVIYEARPQVTVDVATLALKTGNAVILRGGSDVLESNCELVRVLREALTAQDLPLDAVQVIDSPDRDYVRQLLRLHHYVDMIIPRGGAGLHEFCRENSTIPVIIGGMGVVHLYVDHAADLDAALPLIHNAKTQRPAVCNALDTLLVHERVAPEFLPRVVTYLREAGVTFKAEDRARALLPDAEDIAPVQDGDFDTEWMGLTLNLKVVGGLDEAIEHIRAHSTQHSDGILTREAVTAERFLNEVDSAAVFWNASTRFNDGGALGLGAEVAISTQKMHARGPMALQELTTYKWVVIGQNTIRA